MDDADHNAGGEDEEFIEDAAEAPDDPDDDDFKLEGFDDLGIPEDDVEDELDDCEPEYDDNTTGKKRKRRTGLFKNKSLQRSVLHNQTENNEAFILDEDNDFIAKQSSRVPGTFGRRNRRKGETLPAYHKRVSHELDSDDELMMQMREKGFSDRQIADKLARDGRVRYDQKSISTRIMRIRLAQADNVDFLLREGYKEWEYEDDELLIQAHALADIEINYEIERIRAWRFRKVSEYMRRLNKEALFSATACCQRYNDLMAGSARIPTDMDDDPATRRAEMEAYRMSREKVRNIEKAEKDAKDAAEAKRKTEARARNAQKAEEIANKHAAKQAEKAQRAMTRAAQAQIRAQRAQENQTAKAQRNAQIKKQEAAQEAKKRAANKNVTFALTTTKISADTLDPRSYLSVTDLKKMCDDRGLDMPHEQDKDNLVEVLQDADAEYSLNDLQKMCRSKGLNAAGNKVQMRYQLALAAAQTCASFEAGAAAAAVATAGDEDGDDELDWDEE
ncbi:hypothetical protein BDW02DRAFT_491582 [Decorospora gaudefroyi]|uniref:DUF7626 domain-containing protein n=1 Tax=Decorospora gaudefroyi TaxID=184978 RepID=A0A6A5KS97_9PLEO|nr:hypothetical protein BDW02DRAFT_491582 [Decorospora gaudefroyi]